MRPGACWFGALLGAALLTGCVERRFIVNTDPPGAVVLRDGHMIGAAPADDRFDYYGKYRFTLIKDGYETQQVVQDVPAPWYQYPPFDFISENLIPWRIRDVRTFNYALQPAQQASSAEVLEKSAQLRLRGQAIIPAPPPEHASNKKKPPPALHPAPLAPLPGPQPWPLSPDNPTLPAPRIVPPPAAGTPGVPTGW
jgi:hypothetical protein